MVGSKHCTVKPYAGTHSSNQPHTVAYVQNVADVWSSKADDEDAAGNHEKAIQWQQRKDTFRSDFEIRTGGPGSAYVPVGLLLQTTRAAAAAYDPQNVHRWEDARQHGRCIVTKGG